MKKLVTFASVLGTLVLLIALMFFYSKSFTEIFEITIRTNDAVKIVVPVTVAYTIPPLTDKEEMTKIKDRIKTSLSIDLSLYFMKLTAEEVLQNPDLKSIEWKNIQAFAKSFTYSGHFVDVVDDIQINSELQFDIEFYERLQALKIARLQNQEIRNQSIHAVEIARAEAEKRVREAMYYADSIKSTMSEEEWLKFQEKRELEWIEKKVEIQKAITEQLTTTKWPETMEK